MAQLPASSAACICWFGAGACRLPPISHHSHAPTPGGPRTHPPVPTQAPTQEEEALEHAQRAGEAASRRASYRMAEQWLQLTDTPEWRHLAARFPEAVQQLAAAAAGNGVHPPAAEGPGTGKAGGSGGDGPI